MTSLSTTMGNSTEPVVFLDGKVRLYLGDVMQMLALMPDDSVDCVVTSPPYWGLRDYGVAGQLGLEPTLGEHLAAMVAVFRAVRRVLKPEGTCWVNYGDCYATSPNGRSAADTKASGGDDRTFRDKPFSTIGGVLKAKDLCMVPNRLAIALQEDGWWVRSEIIWAKPNPMPESIKDRPATSHEKIFMLTKSARYFYDAAAVRQDAAKSSFDRWAQDVEGQEGSHRANGGANTNGTRKAVGGPRAKQDQTAASAAAEGTPRGEGRNLRNYERPPEVDVWEISTRPFSEAHFATFPPALAERCIKAGCPKGGVVLDIFGGAGTTALVAARLGRKAILIELNPEYADIAQKRIERDWMGEEERRASLTPQQKPEDLPLFGSSAA